MKNTLGKTLLCRLSLAALMLFGATVVKAESAYVLLPEAYPSQAGKIASGQSGSIQAGQSVTITAQPSTGYEFVYWLGAVSDVSNPSTTVTMDGPQYVVAVFEKSEFDLPPAALGAGGGGGGGQASGTGSQSVGGGYGVSPAYAYEPADIIVTPIGPIIPGGNGELPIPGGEDGGDGGDNSVPEPMTIMFLGTGAVGMILKRKH